jgi:hypothetical protein
MQMRPCLISAQRAYFKSAWISDLKVESKSAKERKVVGEYMLLNDTQAHSRTDKTEKELYLQPHGVKAHITSHGSIELVRSDQERDRVGHFLSVQGNSSPLGLLQKKEKDTHLLAKISSYTINALKLSSTTPSFRCRINNG